MQGAVDVERPHFESVLFETVSETIEVVDSIDDRFVAFDPGSGNLREKFVGVVLEFFASPACEGEPGIGVGGEMNSGIGGGLSKRCCGEESEKMSRFVFFRARCC